MQKVLTAAEMRVVDHLTTEKYGIPSLLLMENAAHAAVRVIAEAFGGCSVASKSFLILCGKGNNGGDGAALARILWTLGANVTIHLFGKVAETKGDARINFEIAKKLETEQQNPSLQLKEFEDLLEWQQADLSSFEVTIDALYGTGFSRQAEAQLASNIKKINAVRRNYGGQIISLDLPSGLNSDLSAPIGVSIEADLTITFTAPKPANVLPPASRFNGHLVTVKIGSPQELIDSAPSQLFLAEQSDAQDWLRQTSFKKGSYKNKRGHALLVVGSKNYAGAAVMAGDAAVKTGVGLVTMATPESAREAVAARLLPEVIANGVAETASGAISELAFAEIEKLSEKADVIGIGCGLDAREESTRRLIKKVVENRQTPVVIDADALNALAPFELRGSNELPLILTPHEGEMRRLIGAQKDYDFSDRVQIARDFASKHHVILVLKGERTLIAAPDNRVIINPTGNEGLGKGGSGDTLTGIITGFIAQTIQAADFKLEQNVESIKPIDKILAAVVAALYVAGMAGDLAAKELGMRSMTPSDVREHLSAAFRKLGD